MESMILIAIVVVLIGLSMYLWWKLSIKAAFALISIFTAESMIVRNLHPDSRPEFIMTKVNENTNQLNLLLRPIAMWYINRRGYDIATGIVTYVVFDLQKDQRVTINK